jgi:hypothetical protein
LSHLVEKIVCRVASVPMRERSDHESMLLLHRVEHGDERSEGRGQRE